MQIQNGKDQRRREEIGNSPVRTATFGYWEFMLEFEDNYKSSFEAYDLILL
jgi:hypothetical protein